MGDPDRRRCDANSDSDIDAITHPNIDPNFYAFTHPDGYRYTYGDGHPNGNRDRYAHRDHCTHSYSYGFTFTHPDGHGQRYPDSDADSNSDSNSDYDDCHPRREPCGRDNGPDWNDGARFCYRGGRRSHSDRERQHRLVPKRDMQRSSGSEFRQCWAA